VIRYIHINKKELDLDIVEDVCRNELMKKEDGK
jgi:hypothetical protein